MLDKLRQQSRSFIIWFLFGIIILAFVFTFGPASMRLSCGGATRAGTVAGKEITNGDLQFAVALGLPRDVPATFRLDIYDQLLKREMLVIEAQQMGMRVPEEEIVKMITERRRIWVLGKAIDLAYTGAWPQKRNKEGKRVPAPNYYHDQFKKWVQYQLRMKVPGFMEQQRKELLAQRVVETIKAGVLVSEQEARAVFEYENHSLKLQLARFKIADFQEGFLVSRAEIMRWLSQKENREQVDARYKKMKWKLTGLPPERRVRHIMVKVPPEATDAQKKEARQKLVRLREQLAGTPTDFAKMAQMLSQDTDTRAQGGDLGWREESKVGFGEELAKEVFKLEPGKISAVLSSDRGYHLVLVEAERKGDVPIGEARTWLAEEIILEQKARAAARKVAREALRRLLTGQSMKDVFPEGSPQDAGSAGAEPGAEAEQTKGEKEDDSKPKKWHPLLPAPQEVTLLRTDKTIGALGKVKGLAEKAWKLTEEDPVLGEVVEVEGSGTDPGSLLVIRLEAKNRPTTEGFEANKEQIMSDLLEIKRDDAVRRWVYQRCEALRSQGEVTFEDHVSNVVVHTGKGEERKKTTVKYVPCQRLSRFGQAPQNMPFPQ